MKLSITVQNYQLIFIFLRLGFRKILKKHDKNMNTDTGAKWRAEYVDNAQVNYLSSHNLEKATC
jgi:hypothetical protein